MGNRRSKLTDEEIATLKESTDFTDDDLQRWYKRFHKFGQDDGLTCKAFMKIYGRYFPFGDASKFSKRVFASFDKDGGGTIDFNEFITTLSITMHGQLEEKLTWAFKLYDIDSNGFVTKDEMTEIVTAIFEMVGTVKKTGCESESEKIVEKIFEQMDENNDGQLSLAEFVEGGKRQTFVANMLQVDDKPFQRNMLRQTCRF